MSLLALFNVFLQLKFAKKQVLQTVHANIAIWRVGYCCIGKRSKNAKTFDVLLLFFIEGKLHRSATHISGHWRGDFVYADGDG